VKDGSAVSLVCFDLGGVMVRICHDWRDAAAAAGLDARSRAGVDIDDIWHPLANDHALGRLTKAGWADALATVLGGLYTAHELCTIHDATLQREYEGVGGVVDRIHGAGIATACLSNTNDDHWRRMLLPGGRYPAIRGLGHHFASHLLGVAKPDAAIYRAVESGTGRRGREILFFDDSAANVEAARRIGWNTETIDPHTETAPQISAHLERYGVVSRPDA
jgi:putative hydrolase of the HAD superfamily